MPILLVIDDNPDVREMIANIMRAFDYHVETAAHGGLALEYIRKSGTPDLMLLDLRMPVMNGWEFLKASRASAPYVPIVIVSAELCAENVSSDDARVVGVVPKPFSISSLQLSVESALLYQWRTAH